MRFCGGTLLVGNMLSIIDNDDDDDSAAAAASPQLKLVTTGSSSPSEEDDEEELNASVVNSAPFLLPNMDDSSSRCHLLDDGIIEKDDSADSDLLLLQ
mmetsp:Transcript_10976/g.16556  ORF Transcript_10976/g.16556 Transcript_10976/m.16556 type:complete len:98 (-) Transcript_10976:270-563(-)